MDPKIVVVGSCMIDFTTFSSRLPKPGETIIGTRFHKTFGGKGANQCIAAAKLGASTALVASLGSDSFAQEYLDKLRKNKVNVSHVQLQKDVHSGIAQITVAENGQNSIVIILGANALLLPENVEASVDVIQKSKILLCQFETNLDTTLCALKLHKGHGLSIVNGAPAVADPDPEILRTCDIFCVNELEAEVMTGIAPLTLENVDAAMDVFFEKGCNTVIITFGASGVVFASKEAKQTIAIPTEKVQCVDSTGAGDAFLGAFAYFKGYHPHLSMEESIRRACLVATRSVTKPGTQDSYPSRGELPEELFM